ncbi:hypothetical protein F4808DRAFT_409534 [Astrocystis sublimbata]|nr:hypothetical protein F4808DRAFT_409534 [Astrocystis sublimbata]
MIDGTRNLRAQFQSFCVSSIELLRDSKLPVLWALKIPLGDRESLDQVSMIDLLKYLVQQSIKINDSIHTDATLAPRFGAYLRAQTEEDWVRVLASVLQGIPLIYIVLDIEVLCRSLNSANRSWPSCFLRLFDELSARGMKTIVRIVIVGYGSPLLKGPSIHEYQDFVLTVSDRKQAERSTHRLAIRNRATLNPTEGGTINFGAIARNQQAQSRAKRSSHMLRRVR